MKRLSKVWLRVKNQLLSLDWMLAKVQLRINVRGARSAIASLWIVDDGGTKVLMNAFYGGLQQNLTKAEALRQAQMALITGDDSAVGDARGDAIELVFAESVPSEVGQYLSHPYYWAPFILIGNGL